LNDLRHTSWILATAVATVLLAACQRKEVPAPVEMPTAAPSAAESAPAPAPAAAAPAKDEAPPPGVLRAYVWDCGGTKLKMRNLWRENAVAIDLHDGTHKLTGVISASGARYSDGTVTLSTKGGSARLETPGNPPIQCSELRAESLLEDARIRGVLYHGLGNEPGWTLEIGPGNALAWITGYGEERHDYADVRVSGDDATGFVYTSTDAAGDIKVTVKRAPCQDDMSGEPFDHQFTVTAGGKALRGCGTRVQP
jgi:membrane-bound inhibitor of C-type lysozyme